MTNNNNKIVDQMFFYIVCVARQKNVEGFAGDKLKSKQASVFDVCKLARPVLHGTGTLAENEQNKHLIVYASSRYLSFNRPPFCWRPSFCWRSSFIWDQGQHLLWPCFVAVSGLYCSFRMLLFVVCTAMSMV